MYLYCEYLIIEYNNRLLLLLLLIQTSIMFCVFFRPAICIFHRFEESPVKENKLRLDRILINRLE